MTVIVGILAKDGVVIASDSAASFGAGNALTIGQQNVKKVRTIAKHLIYACSGHVGLSQLIAHKIELLWEADKGKLANQRPEHVMGIVGSGINSVVLPYLSTTTYLAQIGLQAEMSLCKSMLSAPLNNKEAKLFSFGFNGTPEMATEDLPFVSIGSGQTIADPFLAFLKRVFWKDTAPSLAEARLIAVWTIDHVRQTNAGGVGGPVQMTELKANHMVPNDIPHETIQEHREQIAVSEASIVNAFRGSSSIPPPP